MKITREVRDFAAKQNQPADAFIAASSSLSPSGVGQRHGTLAEAGERGLAEAEAEAGMAEMSEVYNETGRELYIGAGGLEHD